jgi:DNA-binding NarL/FixJ family response regulator
LLKWPISIEYAVAGLIRSYHFVTVDSENQMPLTDEPVWPHIVGEIEGFLSGPVPARESRDDALPLDELTQRERAVLEGIAGGLDNTEIAAWLGLSEKTVRNHITRILDKIGVDHRYQAIVRARDAGFGVAKKLGSAF